MERDARNGTSEEDEQRFLRSFSKQVAEALRIKDEEEVKERERQRAALALGNRSNSRLLSRDETTQCERLRSIYVELCHDDPIISGGDEECRRFARALIPKPKPNKTCLSRNEKRNAKQGTLALSSRIVDGILQATSRAVERATTLNDNSGDFSMVGPSKITTSEGYAQIAFAIFVEGPYRCIQQAENLEIVSNFLGSFQPPLKAHNHNLTTDEEARLMNEATMNMMKGMEKLEVQCNTDQNLISSTKLHDDNSSSSSEFFHPNSANNIMKSDNDNDSMNEIFAEESDPDEYDYGTNDDPCFFPPTVPPTIDNYNDLSFNPLQLSEPSQSNQTCEGACKSIQYLLSRLSYSNLAFGSLSSRTWSEWGISETLADLSFMMLLEITNREHHGKGANTNSFLKRILNDHEYTDIGALWDRPLLALRDRALDKNHGYDALPSYLQLLTALLSSQTINPSPKNSVPPTLIVGLSSLGSMCSSKELVNISSSRMNTTSAWSACPREEMKKAIMTSLHSLAHIVEGACQCKSVFACYGSAKLDNDESNNEENSIWVRTVLCLIPIIEYVTNLRGRFDFQLVYEGASGRSATLAESDAKALSESGLFREMLSMFTSTRNENDSWTSETPNAKTVVRMHLLRTILTLSIQSPEVLGCFALRVPDFASEVHSSSFLDNHLVDAILWLTLGSYLGASHQRRFKLRTDSTAPPTEIESLAKRSIEAFASLCKTTRTSLECLQQTLSSSQSTLSDEQKKKCVACTGEICNIIVFSNCLSHCPSMTNVWVQSLKSYYDGISFAREQIMQLKSTIASLPNFTDEATTTHHFRHKKRDDAESELSDDSDDETKVQSMGYSQKDYRSLVGSVRSSVKVISLALDSQTGSALSKTD